MCFWLLLCGNAPLLEKIACPRRRRSACQVDKRFFSDLRSRGRCVESGTFRDVARALWIRALCFFLVGNSRMNFFVAADYKD
jgi:hypothetical protein